MVRNGMYKPFIIRTRCQTNLRKYIFEKQNNHRTIHRNPWQQILQLYSKRGRLNRARNRADISLPQSSLDILSFPSIPLYFFSKSFSNFTLFNMWETGSVMQLLNFEDMRSSIIWPLFADIYLISPRFVHCFSILFSPSFHSFFFIVYSLFLISMCGFSLCTWDWFCEVNSWRANRPLVHENAIWEG
jgi:hypothetical protein